MCIALPMQVVENQGSFAVCEGHGERRTVDMALVGEQPLGTWVLVFLDSAREVISAKRAEQISLALTALDRALDGDPRIDELFPDLAGREPELPDFLKTQNGSGQG
jgi:hydrogenase expression/formation protein HypC